MRRTALFAVVLLVTSCTGSGGEQATPSPPEAVSSRTATPAPSVVAATSSTPSPVPSPPPLGRYFLTTRGLFAYDWERRGAGSGFHQGEIWRKWRDFDPVLGTTVGQEVSRQLDAIKGIGMNTLSVYLERGDEFVDPKPFDNVYVMPDCLVDSRLGIPWPDPGPTVLSNLRAFLDLVASKGMKVQLGLMNSHMDEAEGSATWMGALLAAVKDHPAIDLINIGGNTKHDAAWGKCGQPAEPPLWYGPNTPVYDYLKWAFRLAMSLGYQPHQLTTEAVIGNYDMYSEHRAPGQYATAFTGGHWWNSVRVLRLLYDDLGIAPSERVYALSWYEEPRCFEDPQHFFCTQDAPPHAWAEETLSDVLGKVGGDRAAGARITVTEFGVQQNPATGKPPGWTADQTVESVTALLQKYGLEGGMYWRWSSAGSFREEHGAAVKRRGVEFSYFSVEKELLDAYGYHLFAIPNGSFEEEPEGVPPGWIISGAGSGSTYDLRQEPGQPAVPTRGNFALRLTTGDATESATSARIAVAPSTTYTTTANLRFSWTGDPTPRGAPDRRPQVFIRIRYFAESGGPSSVKASDTFRYFQEDATTGFGTFPVQYQTPSDAKSVQVEIGAARNGLPTVITLDVDNVR